MERTTKTILTNMCMVEDGNGNVLVQYRTKKDWPGYIFPGGHIEKEETIEQSVIREIREETSLEISDVILCGVMEWSFEGDTRYLCFVYKTKSFTGTIKDSDEGRLSWVKKDKLLSYECSIDMDKILAIAESRPY